MSSEIVFSMIFDVLGAEFNEDDLRLPAEGPAVHTFAQVGAMGWQQRLERTWNSGERNVAEHLSFCTAYFPSPILLTDQDSCWKITPWD